MKRPLIITLKSLLALIAFPFALVAVVMFALVTFGKMGAAALLKHRRISAK